MLIALLFFVVCFVAFTNGANANFKGVASLYGSGTTTLRTAALWGTATTFAGSLAALFLAVNMLLAFRGSGVVPDDLVASRHFVCAVALGAAVTSFLATRFGFPVSTTHALVGALIGAGVVGGGEVRLGPLGALFLYPLFFSPVVAALAGALACVLLRAARLMPDRRSRLLDALHFLSAGAASFARGLNDTPKMAALMVAVPGIGAEWGIVIVAAVIAAGGLLDIRRVAETLGKKVTDMNPGQGFVANLVTAILVTTASLHSLPVSTTHVSVGSLFGMGAATRQIHWRKAGEILLAWVSTVPCGALLAALVYALLGSALAAPG
ncbi:MAG TPA: anion permease [Gemmata sp.]